MHVHVDKTQYNMQILKGKYLVYNNFVLEYLS